MFITTGFYDELCPSYKKVIKELDDNLVRLQSDTTENAIILEQKFIENFYSNYLMPKEYWNYYYERINPSSEDFNKSEQQILKTAYKHFYLKTGLDPIPQENVYKHLKLLKFLGGQSDYMTIEADYLYPHSNVKGAFQSYEMNAKWFENLLEVGDTEFVIHNVEYRIGGNLLDKKLWKLYIKFLENSDTNKMLEVYSKYCRFFLDDFEMKEEYKAKVEKYGP
uniref:Uncharacterized protein n=1 Tax=Panagrolaimus sp. PS1159 TaxID=55785 RepID=A0AC35FYA2_9BILA